MSYKIDALTSVEGNADPGVLRPRPRSVGLYSFSRPLCGNRTSKRQWENVRETPPPFLSLPLKGIGSRILPAEYLDKTKGGGEG